MNKRLAIAAKAIKFVVALFALGLISEVIKGSAAVVDVLSVAFLIGCDYLIFRQSLVIERLERTEALGMRPIDSFREAFSSDATDIHLASFKKIANNFKFTFTYNTYICVPRGTVKSMEASELSRDILLRGIKKDHFIPESHRAITTPDFTITSPFWSKYYRVHWALPGVGRGITVCSDVLT